MLSGCQTPPLREMRHAEMKTTSFQLVSAIAVLTALALPLPTGAVEQSKYPDFGGQWVRAHERAQWDPSKPRGLKQEAPLTPEYQAIFEANLAELYSGNLGADPQLYCYPSGMPRMMIAYEPMEMIVTPE